MTLIECGIATLFGHHVDIEIRAINLFLNKIAAIQGSAIKIQLLSACFSLIITTFVKSKLLKNGTKKKHCARRLTVRDVKIAC